MNIILRKVFLLLLSVLSVGMLRAQIPTVTIELQTFKNLPVEHEFTSSPGPASIYQAPTHGTTTKETISTFNYRITYQPEEDYTGDDSYELYFFSGTLKRMIVHVEVLPYLVEAKHDFATTTMGQSVSIPVLDNDYSSNEVFLLAAIPAANHGWAEYSDVTSSITFHPEPGFSGLTHFNYVLCNGEGVCDNGTVSVSVEPVEAIENEEIQIFTKLNTPQVVLVPHDYTLITPPANGTFDGSGITPIYTPSTDFHGSDQLVFENNGHTITVYVTVINAVENVFLSKDEAFTTTVEPVEINVLENDLYGAQTGCVSFGQPEFGTLITQAEDPSLGYGQVLYVPEPGFEGTDAFEYTGHEWASCNSAEETTTVYVHVSNFEPAASTFYMSTPKRTPLFIGYDLPVTAYEFSVVAEPDFGEVLYLEGYVDTLIYGHQVSGYNLLVYVPNENVEEGEDDFEIQYCALDSDGNCALPKTVKIEMGILNIGDGSVPMCFDDCVWPGDTNFDGTVNMEDLLPIGISMGEIGTTRQESNINYWYGQYADNWNGPFNDDPVDLKHIDADGDSIVTALDTIAIHNFYGRTHALVPNIDPFYENEIFLYTDQLFFEEGDVIELEMHMGTSNDPAIDVYGFTIPLEYDTANIAAGSIEVEFFDQSWLNYNSPVLSMQHDDLQGKFEAGFTRTSGLAASGHGAIGKIRLIGEIDVIGIRPGGPVKNTITLGGQIATVMNSAGVTSKVRIGEITLNIISPEERPADYNSLDPVLLKLWPNPTSDILNIHLNGSQTFEEFAISDMTGRTMMRSDMLSVNNSTVDVSQWSEGLYFLSVYTKDGVITKKFEVVKK